MKKYWEKFTDKFGNTILHPQYIYFYFSKNVYNEIAKLSKNKKLIDIGCGRMPYKKKFESFLQKYIGVDHPSVSKLYKGNEKPDVLADVCKHIPVKDKSFDVAIMLEVLQYLEDPLKAFHEIKRLLKKGGYLILTTPFLYPLHDLPYDRNRFTPTQIESFLKRSGFKLKRLNVGGNFISFWLLSLNVYLLKTIMDILKSKKTFFKLIYLLILLIITPFFVVADNLIFLITKDINLGNPNYFPLNFLVIAIK